MKKHVGLLTCATLPNLAEDDFSLVQELSARGYTPLPLVWSDPAERWRECDALLIRSTWDYNLRISEYRDLLSRVERAGIPLWNPVPLALWNSDKGYLRELESRGAKIPKTIWLDSPAEVPGAIAQAGWNEAVLKPRVSAGARETFRIRNGQMPSGLASAPEVRWMLQEFRSEVTAFGEVSLLYFGGEFSHAVLKTPASGDFRVQAEHGGGTRAFSPPPELLAQAERILALIPKPWLYARVDAVVDSSLQLVLMELELIEPCLFLSYAPQAAARLVDACEKLW